MSLGEGYATTRFHQSNNSISRSMAAPSTCAKQRAAEKRDTGNGTPTNDEVIE
jgi:hypothetical protein